MAGPSPTVSSNDVLDCLDRTEGRLDPRSCSMLVSASVDCPSVVAPVPELPASVGAREPWLRLEAQLPLGADCGRLPAISCRSLVASCKLAADSGRLPAPSCIVRDCPRSSSSVSSRKFMVQGSRATSSSVSGGAAEPLGDCWITAAAAAAAAAARIAVGDVWELGVMEATGASIVGPALLRVSSGVLELRCLRFHVERGPRHSGLLKRTVSP